MNNLYHSWLIQHLENNKTNRELVNISEAKKKVAKVPSEAKKKVAKVPSEAKKKVAKVPEEPSEPELVDVDNEQEQEPKPSKRSKAAIDRNVDDRLRSANADVFATNPEDLAAALHGIRHASELEQAIGSPDSILRLQPREPSKGTGAQYRKTESPENVISRMMREGYFGNMAARAGKAAGGIAKAGAGAVNMAEKLAGQAGGAFKTGMGSSLGTAADKIKSGPLAQKLGKVGGAIKGKVGGAIKVVGGLTKQVSSNPTVRGLASRGVDAIKAKLNDNGSKPTGTPVPPDGGAKPVAAGAKPAAGGESAPAGGSSSSTTNTVGRDQTNSNNTTTNNYGGGGGGAGSGAAVRERQASELGIASGGDIIRGGAREASSGRVPAISGRPRISMNEETKPQSNLSRIMEMRNRLSAKYGD